MFHHRVHAEMFTNLTSHPWRPAFPAFALLRLRGQFVSQRSSSWGRAFLASAVFIIGMLTTMAAGLYPHILPARDGRLLGLTIDNAASGEHALTFGLRSWSLGIVWAIGYFIVAYRFMFGRRA